MKLQGRDARASVVVLLAFGSLAIGPAARAQSDDDVAKKRGFDEVVVTAERRVENLQTSALSATVLNADMLEKKGVIDLTTVQYAAPGVQIADYDSANTFNIRGIGQARVDIDLPSGVVIYRDGVPTLTGYFQNAPYYDMSSVEVLRGPQGTFAGKAAAAGAVFIRTRDPELGSLGGNVMMGGGNQGFFETTGVVNVPVSDTLALRLSGHFERRDSLFDSITTNPLPGGQNAAGPYNGSDTRNLKSLRLGILWQPSDRFSAMFKIDDDNLYFGNHGTTGLDPLTGKPENIRRLIANGDHRYRDQGQRASLKLSWDLANGMALNSLTGYSTVDTRANWDANGSDPSPLGFLSGGTFTNWSQEFDLLSPEDAPVRWVTGLFWQKYLSDIPPFTKNGFGFALDNGTRLDYTTPWKKDEKSYAGFGQIEYDITHQLELQVGARWNHYEFTQFTNFAIDFVSFATAGDPAGTGIGIETTLTFLEQGGAGFKQDFSENSVDWKASLNYTPSEDQFLYALISRGHTPGSINLADPDFFATPQHDEYKEMSVVNYELGWKGTFFDQRLRTQLDGYYQVFKDYQADFALAGPAALPSSTLFQFQNADTDSIVYGVELGAQAMLANLEVDLGLAYFKSELGSFGIVQDEFSLMYGGSPTVDLDGAETPFAPEWTGNIGVGYTFHLANGPTGKPLDITPRVDVAYRDDAYSRLFRNSATLLPSYTLVNAQIRLESGRWSLALWGNNLTDKKYVAAKQNVSTAGPTATIPFDHFTGIVYGGLRRLYGMRLSVTL